MKELLTHSRDGVTIPALLTKPTGFDPTKESLPLILFLHGIGERGDDIREGRVIHGFTEHFIADQDYHGLRVLTLTPQCPMTTIWTHLLPLLKELTDRVVAETNADPARVTVTGLSMGGFGAWDMLQTYPDFFAAGAPLCGGGLPWNMDKLKNVPVRAYHGTEDDAVPFGASVYMVEALRRAGGDVTFTEMPGYGHDIWTDVYGKTDLIEWLAAARKK